MFSITVSVRYPGAVRDPDTGEWISDAEVAECAYTAFVGTRHEVTARLVVRRVKDKNHQDALFPESKHRGVGARWCPQIPTPTPATPASWSNGVGAALTCPRTGLAGGADR
jgi:hypothetical protein